MIKQGITWLTELLALRDPPSDKTEELYPKLTVPRDPERYGEVLRVAFLLPNLDEK